MRDRENFQSNKSNNKLVCPEPILVIKCAEHFPYMASSIFIKSVALLLLAAFVPHVVAGERTLPRLPGGSRDRVRAPLPSPGGRRSLEPARTRTLSRKP